MMELFSLSTTEMYFTTAKKGETLQRYNKIKENDLILADRCYGTIKGICHLLEKKAHYVFRLKANSFNLYTANGEKYDLTEELKKGEFDNQVDKELFFKKDNKLIPIRICVLKKSDKDIKKV